MTWRRFTLALVLSAVAATAIGTVVVPLLSVSVFAGEVMSLAPGLAVR